MNDLSRELSDRMDCVQVVAIGYSLDEVLQAIGFDKVDLIPFGFLF